MWLDHLLSREINGITKSDLKRAIHPKVEVEEVIRVLSNHFYLIIETRQQVFQFSVCSSIKGHTLTIDIQEIEWKLK